MKKKEQPYGVNVFEVIDDFIKIPIKEPQQLPMSKEMKDTAELQQTCYELGYKDGAKAVRKAQSALLARAKTRVETFKEEHPEDLKKNRKDLLWPASP